jgi:hypothetical protein
MTKFDIWFERFARALDTVVAILTILAIVGML